MYTRDKASEHGSATLIATAPTTTLRAAAQELYRADIGILAVRDEGHLVGLLSERDLVRAVAHHADLDTLTVAEAMSSPPVTARPDDPVLDVALVMLDDGIRHLPLVDEYGRQAGLISLRDLIRPLVLQAMTPPEPVVPRLPYMSPD
jgi:CBS domain-containing protein